jgi:replicative DNA helicase|tara:strand:+ start:2004 stop:3224 length:1221 start_codon:yes stop_codon:yes gene_type:complete
LNYETKLLNAIAIDGNYVKCAEENLRDVFIEYGDIWSFIAKHYDEHKKVPSRDTIKHHFPEFEVCNVQEPLDYYIGVAQKESLSHQIRVALSRGNDIVEDTGPKEAIGYLMSRANELIKVSSSLKDTNLVEEWKDRADDLNRRSKEDNRKMLGVPSGISIMDSIFGGWQKGDFIVLLGWTGTGKSFLSRLFAANAWKAGYTPLVISLEMNKQQESQRIDTILNNGEGHFTNTDLVTANPSVVDDYRKWAMNTFEDKHPIYLVTSEGLDTADQHMVQAKIDQYKPDLVILDYHGLFDDASGSRNETEKAKNLSKAFKRMAVKNGVPIIDVAAVTMSDGHSERPPELEEVAWSKQLAYDADLVLSMHRDFESEVFQVVSRKVRRAGHFGFYLRWNLDTGSWNEEWDLS